MKKKIFILVLLVITVISFSGCDKKVKNKTVENKKLDSERFKEEYESLNGKKNESGKKYRELEINSDNPIIYKSAKDIVNMIDEKETFVVYFGYESCPWCRSIVPSLLKAAKDNAVEEIYYVNIKNIRDELVLKDKKVITKRKGMDAYYDLLDKLDDVLKKYELSYIDEDDEEVEVDTKEKRIYAPNVVLIKDGKPFKLVTGISEDFKDPYDKLTDEITDYMYKEFNKVLKEVESSGASCSMDKKC